MSRCRSCLRAVVPEEDAWEAAQLEYEQLVVKRDRAEAAARRARDSADAAWGRMNAAFDTMMERLHPGWAAEGKHPASVAKGESA